MGTNKKPLQARSPTYDADQIQARVSLIPASAGKRAPIKHARVIKSALDKAEKSYEWLRIKASGHGFYNEENREIAYRYVLDFCMQTRASLKRLFLQFPSIEHEKTPISALLPTLEHTGIVSP